MHRRIIIRRRKGKQPFDFKASDADPWLEYNDGACHVYWVGPYTYTHLPTHLFTYSPTSFVAGISWLTAMNSGACRRRSPANQRAPRHNRCKTSRVRYLDAWTASSFQRMCMYSNHTNTIVRDIKGSMEQCFYMYRKTFTRSYPACMSLIRLCLYFTVSKCTSFVFPIFFCCMVTHISSTFLPTLSLSRRFLWSYTVAALTIYSDVTCPLSMSHW